MKLGVVTAMPKGLNGILPIFSVFFMQFGYNLMLEKSKEIY
jgi:hypothetical protein